ncbi:Hypothetical predicted protein, partial [Olea europaea subsp. europaea]
RWRAVRQEGEEDERSVNKLLLAGSFISIAAVKCFFLQIRYPRHHQRHII